MTGFVLDEERQQLRDSARRFAEREIAPVADRLDEGALDEGTARTLYRRVFERAVAPGFLSLTVPEEHGGAGCGAMEVAVVGEEFGAADVGLGSSLTLSMTVSNLLTVAAAPERRADLLADIVAGRRAVLSGALNEPNTAGSELFCPDPDPQLGLRTVAIRDRDEYVLTGQKAAFVTNGGVADAYFVFARTDLSRPFQDTTSIFYVPAELDGVRTGPKTKLMGLRGSWHAELILDEVRVPADHRIGSEGEGPMLMATATPAMAIGLAAGYVGLARRTLDYALEYSSTRESWGRPIRDHQAVALKLADMAVDVDAARLVVWDAAAAIDRGDPLVARKCPAAKTFAVDVAIAAAQRCVEILGGYGVSEEYLAQRFLRDAWAGYACDFTRDVLRLGIAATL